MLIEPALARNMGMIEEGEESPWRKEISTKIMRKLGMKGGDSIRRGAEKLEDIT